MKLVTLIISALLAIGVTLADEKAVKYIDHDKVQPFPQSKPNTFLEASAINFKPMLSIKVGCHPYPAVNKAGEVSAGLKNSGAQDGDCNEPPPGSQIYVRSETFELARIHVYMWFFPKTYNHRFYFRTVAVITTNPGNGPGERDPIILACSIQDASPRGYSFHHPCPAENLRGDSMKIMYDQFNKDDNTVALTDVEGDFQQAVIWEDLTQDARNSLNTKNVFDHQIVTINEENFKKTVDACITKEEYELITKGLQPPPSA